MLRDQKKVSGLDKIVAFTWWIPNGTRMNKTVPSSFFDQLYAQKADPWDFETSPYEDGKYRETTEALPRSRYSRGLEIGCSIGVLTSRLGQRCDTLIGLDVSEQALEKARARCAQLPGVSFERKMVPSDFPSGEFDLVVVSEVAYYWSVEDFARVKDLIADHQPPGGHLILVHWLPFVEEHVRSGDIVHEAWLGDPRWKSLQGTRREKYRLDLLERVP